MRSGLSAAKSLHEVSSRLRARRFRRTSRQTRQSGGGGRTRCRSTRRIIKECDRTTTGRQREYPGKNGSTLYDRGDSIVRPPKASAIRSRPPPAASDVHGGGRRNGSVPRENSGAAAGRHRHHHQVGQLRPAVDPGDDFLWRLLAARSGAGLVTGDSALLERPPPRTRVISPRAWFDDLSAG